MKPSRSSTERPLTNWRALAICLALIAAFTAYASPAPMLIPFQGRLANPQNVPYVTGQYTITFALYDQPVGGSVLWTETHAKVGVISGMVNVFLGSINPLAAVDFSQTRHLGITIDADNNPNTSDPEMVPRQMIIPAFWAKQADNSTKLANNDWTAILVSGNDPINGKILGSKIQPSGITAAQIAPATVTADQIAPGTITSAQIATNTIRAANLDPDLAFDSITPPGTISAFGGANIPTGWLPCDGRAVNNNQYPRLFSAISTNWGAGIAGSTNNFNLPDLRGMFLRGVSAGRSDGWQDPEAAARTNSIPTGTPQTGGLRTGNSGNRVGSLQLDIFEAHTHPVREGNGSISGDGDYLDTNGTPTGSSRDSVVRPSGGAETRPKNAYVNYIIKC
jgi:hypothetical protein